VTDGINDTQLISLVDRAVSLKTTIAEINGDLSGLYKEAASNGYDKAALKECVKIAMEDADKRQKRSEKDDTLSVYLSALGLM
jgi:uncharacterized protein (UPF0335 family)